MMKMLFSYSNMKRNDKRNALLELHKQFGHASQEKLLNLLKTAGMVDQETKYLLKDIYKKFAIFHKYTSYDETNSWF